MVPYVLMFGLSCLNFRLAYLLRKYKTIKNHVCFDWTFYYHVF